MSDREAAGPSAATEAPSVSALAAQLEQTQGALDRARGELVRLRRAARVDHEQLVALTYRVDHLQWALTNIRTRRPYAIARLLRDTARQPRELGHLPARITETLRTRRPERPDRPELLTIAADVPAQEALEAGDYERAIALAEQLLEANPRRPTTLDILRTAQYKTGEVSAAAGTLARRREIADGRELAASAALLRGRLLETEPGWLPRVTGPPRPVQPRSAETVMHLLKESAPYHVNGFCMRSRYTLTSQRAAGLDPFVVTSLGFPRKDGFTDFPEQELVDAIPHFRLDLGPSYPRRPPFDQQLRDDAWLSARIARRERPAVIHAGSGFRGYEPALVGLALREHLQLPLVYEVRSFFETTWTGELDRAEHGEYFRRRFETENRCMRSADAVITIGDAMRAEIIDRGVPEDRVYVVPNGVDPEAFTPQPKDAALATRYGLGERPVFGYVSNLDHPREGQELLVEAAAQLRARGRDFACLIVGDGQRRGELERLASRLGVTDRVVFTGKVPHEDVPQLYALIDIFVVPRRDERAARLVTPLKPYEAMALGKTVVVSDLPALVELARPGERGLAFRPEDPTALAAVVEQLVDHPELSRRLAEEGRRWVLTERTWAANGPRYREVYDRVRRDWAERRSA